MDMREFAGTNFINLDDLANGPLQQKIVDVQKGSYGRPDLHFESGERLSLNVTNVRVLTREFGYDSKGWKDKAVELYVGEVEFKGEKQKSVLVRPIKPDGNNNAGELPAQQQRDRSVSDDLNDDVPF